MSSKVYNIIGARYIIEFKTYPSQLRFNFKSLYTNRKILKKKKKWLNSKLQYVNGALVTSPIFGGLL